MKKIAIVVCESAWAGSIALPTEILKTAIAFQKRRGRNASFEVKYVGISKHSQTSFSGIEFVPQVDAASDDQLFDAVLLPTIWGVNSRYLSQHAALYPWLRRQHQHGALIFGLLTGSYFMAEAGLLDGHSATTHWKYADDFRRRYPKVALRAEKMLTEDDGLYCGGGVTASMDLSMILIHRFCGRSIAQQCERHCLMGSRRDYQRIRADVNADRSHKDSRISMIQDWLESHFAEPLSLEEVSARFGFSERNLTRRFKQATGRSFYQYLQDHRINVAKDMLANSSESIQEVCFNVGYESLTVFGRRFKAAVGMSASQYRDQQQTT